MVLIHIYRTEGAGGVRVYKNGVEIGSLLPEESYKSFDFSIGDNYRFVAYTKGGKHTWVFDKFELLKSGITTVVYEESTSGIVVSGFENIYVSFFDCTTAINSPKYTYTIDAPVGGCEYWNYIEKTGSKIVLRNKEAIKIVTNIETHEWNDFLDTVAINFYHICGSGLSLSTRSFGKLYSFVDGYPSLPTVGVQDRPVRMNIALSPCTDYGTNFFTTWDTDDTAKIGRTEFVYVYKGVYPLSMRSLELYITTVMDCLKTPIIPSQSSQLSKLGINEFLTLGLASGLLYALLKKDESTKTNRYKHKK